MATDDLISELLASNCLKFGDFTLKSGAQSKYYIDFRESTAHPNLYNLIIDRLVKKVREEVVVSTPANRVVVAGVPYGVVPIAFGVARDLGSPYAALRKEPKAHGREVDFEHLRDHRFVLVEDVMTSGSSIIDTLKKLEGKSVTDVFIIANREAGGDEKLRADYPNIKVHSLLRASDILKAQSKHN